MTEAKLFEVPFAASRAALSRVPRSTRVVLRSADDVDRDTLFTLDTELRRSTPGNADWPGDRAAFDEEMTDPEYSPDAYLVALAGPASTPVGLIRFWRNDATPKLGLVGVLPGWRDGRIALTLLAAGLDAASTWGSPVFRTHTARPALQRRLTALGATRA